MMMKDKKIIFFGTPNFALPTLTALQQASYNIVLVVTKPDQPVGRNLIKTPSLIKILSQQFGYQICNNLTDLKLKISDLKPDLGVVVAYGKIIPKEILDAFPLGCLNLHPSLLPKYRGPSPIQSAILNGDQETGVTIIKLDEEMDHGPIVRNYQLPITNNQTLKSLHDQLSREAAKLLIETLPDYLSGKIKPVPQDDRQATYTKIITKEDSRIDWQKNAEEIERQIRAFYPWPGSFTEIKTKNNKILRIKILSARLAKGLHGTEGLLVAEGSASAGDLPLAEAKASATDVGKFQQKNGHLYVQGSDGVLEILRLQPEGKKVMTAKEFINGYIN